MIKGGRCCRWGNKVSAFPWNISLRGPAGQDASFSTCQPQTCKALCDKDPKIRHIKMINFQILGVSPLGVNSSSCCCSFIFLCIRGKQTLVTPAKEHQTLDGSQSFETKVSNALAKLSTTEKPKQSHSPLFFCNLAFNLLSLPREERRHTMMASPWSLLGLAASCYMNTTSLSP